MRWLLFSVVFFCGCRSETLSPVELCGQPCFDGDRTTLRVGVCVSGKYDCSSGTPVCVGQVLPGPESCNGVDDNCNGQVDEEVAGCCAKTGPELCDGIDNDCDGEVDEAEDLPVDFCYDGPRETAAHGACRPGVKRCTMGKWACEGQVLPTAETCNRIDDDCDGKVDEDLGGTYPVDIVFVVDNSTSMESKIFSARTAAKTFASKYSGHPEVRWAVVTAPGDDPNKLPLDAPHLYLNLTTPEKFEVAMENQNARSLTGSEPTLDALLQVCSPANPLGLSWAPNSQKVIVLLTDEDAQSYDKTKLTTVADVISTCASSRVPVYAYVSRYPLDPDWRKIAVETGGSVEDIEDPKMDENLKTTINSLVCR